MWRCVFEAIVDVKLFVLRCDSLISVDSTLESESVDGISGVTLWNAAALFPSPKARNSTWGLRPCQWRSVVSSSDSSDDEMSSDG